MISRWLVQRSGPAYIHLLSRSGRVADVAAAASLAATAACISSVMSDAGSPADAATALGAAAGLGPALQAVLHSSGVLADGLLDKQTAGSFRWVGVARVCGRKRRECITIPCFAARRSLRHLTRGTDWS